MLLKPLIDGLTEVLDYRVRSSRGYRGLGRGDGEPGSAPSQCVGLFLCTRPGPAGGVSRALGRPALVCRHTARPVWTTAQVLHSSQSLRLLLMRVSEWFESVLSGVVCILSVVHAFICVFSMAP